MFEMWKDKSVRVDGFTALVLRQLAKRREMTVSQIVREGLREDICEHDDLGWLLVKFEYDDEMIEQSKSARHGGRSSE